MSMQAIESIVEDMNSHFSKGNYNEADSLARKVIDVLPKETNSTHRIQATKIIAQVAVRQGNYIQALKLFKDVYTESIIIKDSSNSAYSLRYIGQVYLSMGDTTKAIEHLNLSLSIYEDINDCSGIAHTLSSIGVGYRLIEDFTKSLEYLNKSLELFTRIDDKTEVARLIAGIGLVYQSQGNFLESLKYSMESLAMYEKLNNKSQIAFSYQCIGALYNSLEDYHTALQYYRNALTIHEELSEKNMYALSINNMASIYHSMGDFTSSLDLFSQALALHIEMNEEHCIARTTLNLGALYQSIGDFETSRNNYQKALDSFYKLGANREVVVTMCNMGVLYGTPEYSKCDFNVAERYLLDAVNLSVEAGVSDLQIECYNNLTELYEKYHKWELGFTYHKKYHELFIEIQNEEVKKQADKFGWERKIAEMEKQKEIDRLTTEQEKLEAQYQYQLKANEAETMIHELVRKNSFLHEVRRDVKQLAKNATGSNIETAEHLITRLERNIVPLESKAELEKQWHEVHAEFMEKLNNKFPDMSPMEIKICALLKMRLTSSNISTILFLSRRTVEFHRLNIRKKMGLSKNDDLHIVLNNIVSTL